MVKHFDETKWDHEITHPDWYMRIWDELNGLMQKSDDEGDNGEIKQELRNYFLDRIRRNMVALGFEGDDLDAERQSIDTVVIHHTSNSEPYDLEKLNVVQMLNIYVPYFHNPQLPQEMHFKGMPLWSNHIRKGKPVFWAYHWLVRRNGSLERLLEDNELGWHAGNWDINCRSVAICLDNDYENSSPSPAELEAIASIIHHNYPHLNSEKIFGHLEVNKKTICPGHKFLTSWKADLIDKYERLTVN